MRANLFSFPGHVFEGLVVDEFRGFWAVGIFDSSGVLADHIIGPHGGRQHVSYPVGKSENGERGVLDC